VVDQMGAKVVECARDGITGVYLRDPVDLNAYVAPAGETRCFVVLADDGSNDDPFDDAPEACDSFGLFVHAPEGLEDEDCFDFTCALGASEDCS
jgi:hypothetical protein